MRTIDKIVWYRNQYGTKALLIKIIRVLFGLRSPAAIAYSASGQHTGLNEYAVQDRNYAAAAGLIHGRFPSIQPLSVFTAPGPAARVNLVTDSINSGSLFGGVGTAIILSALLAKRKGAKLRVVTRTQPAVENGFSQVLKCNQINFDGNVDFVHIGVDDPRAQLDICAGDRFLTTSWWTTASVLGSVNPGQVDYLLQEDERMFYPFGDDWLRCSEILHRKDIRYLINTKLLFDHFIADGMNHLSKQAAWFEPAFPTEMFHAAERPSSTGKKRLFFYARPNNLRNLFYRGIEALDAAVAQNLLDPEIWEICFVGKDVPKVVLGGVVEPTVIPTMGWREYGEFVRSVDLGFCLMGTPHPSYPPLDLASSGAVVVTNTFGIKKDLSQYSENILLSDLTVESLLAGLERGVRLAMDNETRRANYQRNRASRSWADSFGYVLEFLD